MGYDAAFWKQAMRGLPWFRFLRRSLTTSLLDELLGDWDEWLELKAKIEPGDKIWPFEIHVRSYLGMRKGFLVLRCGKPIGGIVGIVS
jgi:hypothetical protein